MASRRQYERLGCSIPARLTVSDLIFDAMLVNFCENGLLIDCSPESADSLVNQLDEITESKQAFLSCYIDSELFEIYITLRRAHTNFFGVFVHEGLPPQMYNSLLTTSTQNQYFDAHDVPKNVAGLSTSRRRLVAHDIVLAFQKNLVPALDLFFRNLSTDFAQSAEKNTQPENIKKLYGYSELVLNQNRKLSKTYIKTVQDQMLSSFTSKKTIAQHVSVDNLSLIESDLFDQWIAVKAAAQRIENSVHQRLNLVINRLKSEVETPEESIYLPRGHTKALHELLAAYTFDQQAQKIALESFSKRMTSAYEQYIDVLNNILEKHGYAPKITLNRIGSRQKLQTTNLNDSDSQSSNSDPQLNKLLNQSKVEVQHDSIDEDLGSTSLKIANDSIAKVKALIEGLHFEKNARKKEQVDGSQSEQSQNSVIQPTLVQTLQTQKIWSKDEIVSSLRHFFDNKWSSLKNKSIASNINSNLLLATQSQAQLHDYKISQSDQNALELVDTFFNEILNNSFLVLAVRQQIDLLRPLFAIDYLDKGIEFYTHSKFKTMVFNLQAIAHEPMVWIGCHKRKLLEAYDSFAPNSQSSFVQATDILSDAIIAIDKQFNVIRQKNKNRLKDGAISRYEINKKRNKIQESLSLFVSSENLVPKWFEQLMRLGWCEQMCLFAVRDQNQEKNSESALSKTRFLFDTASLAIKKGVSLDETLIEQSLDIIEYIFACLVEMQSGYDILNEWRENFIDILHGHATEFSRAVPAGQWFSPSSEVVSPNCNPYLLNKLKLIEEKQWLYCPHLEREKTYLQVAWVSPKNDIFLLVNHSYVGAGEYTKSQLLELLSASGTRMIVENQLPFVPRGIEHHFYQVYDKIRNGLMRDRVTGYLTEVDFKAQIRPMIAKNNEKFFLVVAKIDKADTLGSVYGSEMLSHCVAQIAIKMSDTVDHWHNGSEKSKIKFLARINDDHLAFCFCINLENTAILKPSLIRFLASLDEHLATISLAELALDLKLKYKCLLNEFIVDSSVHSIISALCHEYHPSNEGGSRSKVQFLDQAHLKFEHQRQKNVSLIHNITLETLAPLIEVKRKIIVRSNGDVVYTRIFPMSKDQEFLETLLLSEKAYIIDEYLIQSAIDMLCANNDNETVSIFVTLSSNILDQNNFFEILYSKMSKLPKNYKLHFGFDNQYLPSIETLADFCAEIKTYGSKVGLFNWGLSPQSFEVLQYDFFDLIAIDESLLGPKNEERMPFLSTLSTLAYSVNAALVMARMSDISAELMSKMNEVLKPTYYEENITFHKNKTKKK